MSYQLHLPSGAVWLSSKLALARPVSIISWSLERRTSARSFHPKSKSLLPITSRRLLFPVSFANSRLHPMQPVVVVGDNFVPGLTTVRFVGECFDGFVATDAWKRRVGSIVDSLPFGQYQVTAYNGSLASETITVHLE